MALVLGTNCGFVTEAPVDDPTGNIDFNTRYRATNLPNTSPATAVKITEIGWWSGTATNECNFEVGLYAADGAVVPGEAGTRLYVDDTNAKGTDAGWKRVTVDWVISSNTLYWLAIQVDGSFPSVALDYTDTGGPGMDYVSVDALPNPFGGEALYNPDGIVAIYAVWEAGEPSGTNIQISVGNSWKLIPAIQISIGNDWKVVAGMQINIGNAWKVMF